MHIVTIVGARPQFIKAAVLSRVISNLPDVTESIVHTGQHYDARMSDIFFDELELPQPQHTLHVGSGSHARQTGEIMIAIEQLLMAETPDAVLVYGDTNSTIAGALTAAKLGIPVAHVEAGLRSFDRSMPEEINRCVTDHVSTWHFCPTEGAANNLRREGITRNVSIVGDVMYDALLYYSRESSGRCVLDEIGVDRWAYALCTIHRAGNTDDPQRFCAIWHAISLLADELPVVLPLHPRTLKVIGNLDLCIPDGVHVIEPVGYLEMLELERHSRLILTDSGGVQKEAYMQRIPCLTMRQSTEWTETVDAGWNRLVGSDPQQLIAAVADILSSGPPETHPELYGDGHAGEKVMQLLKAA
jgi:UDP-N-acetylglucosamine 2-epimerase